MEEAAAPFIFVTVGTDHHPFNRLVDWVDGWLRHRPGRARCLIQCGTSSPPSTAEWRAYLSYDELQSSIRRAVAVVCHGGPATIMESLRHGLVPIVVPRRSDLGEHVDDHQGLFTTRLDDQGEIRLVALREDLWGLLDQAVEQPEAFRIEAEEARGQEAVQRFARLVDALVEPRARELSERREGKE